PEWRKTRASFYVAGHTITDCEAPKMRGDTGPSVADRTESPHMSCWARNRDAVRVIFRVLTDSLLSNSSSPTRAWQKNNPLKASPSPAPPISSPAVELDGSERSSSRDSSLPSRRV